MDNKAKELDKYIKERRTQEECVGFIHGYEAAEESLYTEEEVLNLLIMRTGDMLTNDKPLTAKEWFENFKK